MNFKTESQGSVFFMLVMRGKIWYNRLIAIKTDGDFS